MREALPVPDAPMVSALAVTVAPVVAVRSAVPVAPMLIAPSVVRLALLDRVTWETPVDSVPVVILASVVVPRMVSALLVRLRVAAPRIRLFAVTVLPCTAERLPVWIVRGPVKARVAATRLVAAVMVVGGVAVSLPSRVRIAPAESARADDWVNCLAVMLPPMVNGAAPGGAAILTWSTIASPFSLPFGVLSSIVSPTPGARVATALAVWLY